MRLLEVFLDVFRGQNNLKTPHSNDQCEAFHLLSYCRNWLGLDRSLISRSSIWRLIPLTNLHCLKQVVILGTTDHFFNQPTTKNITRTIWISKKTKWKPSFDYRFSFAWFRLGKTCYELSATIHQTNQSPHPPNLAAESIPFRTSTPKLRVCDECPRITSLNRVKRTVNKHIKQTPYFGDIHCKPWNSNWKKRDLQVALQACSIVVPLSHCSMGAVALPSESKHVWVF